MLATEDPLKMPTNLARDCLSESPFLNVEETLSQKLYNIWYVSLNVCMLVSGRSTSYF